MSEEMWMQRAQSCEAKFNTLKQAYEPAIERVQNFKKNFGIKEGSDGEIDIDFDKFVENLGLEAYMTLRKVGDEKYNVSDTKTRIRAV